MVNFLVNLIQLSQCINCPIDLHANSHVADPCRLWLPT